jgi:pimeloyl-ACP methyl ester carboxylesterase
MGRLFVSLRPVLAVLIVLSVWLSAPAMAGVAPKHGYFTASDGVRIHYLTAGHKGTWVVLIHGYTDNAQRMFFDTGIAQALAVNHRVVAIDNRNHGLSDKPEPYGLGKAEDVMELMNNLKIEKAHLHGYSMGGSITARLMARSPERFITAVFGGSGIGESDEKLRSAASMLDPAMPEPQGAEAQMFTVLRESSAARTAAAKVPGAKPAQPRPPLQVDLKAIRFPVLAINGEYDRPFSKTQRMWRELGNFQNVIIPKKNHVSAIMIGGPMPPEYIDALVKFINSNDPPGTKDLGSKDGIREQPSK